MSLSSEIKENTGFSHCWHLSDARIVYGFRLISILKQVGCLWQSPLSNTKSALGFRSYCGLCAGGHFQVDNELLSLQQRHSMEEVAAKHDGPTKMTNSPTKKGKLTFHSSHSSALGLRVMDRGSCSASCYVTL